MMALELQAARLGAPQTPGVYYGGTPPRRRQQHRAQHLDQQVHGGSVFPSLWAGLGDLAHRLL